MAQTAEASGGMVTDPAQLNYAGLTPEQQALADAAWNEAGAPGGSAADWWDSQSYGLRASYLPDNQQIAPSSGTTSTEVTSGTKGNAETSAPAKYDLEKASNPNFYKSVENNRRDMNQPPPPAAKPAGDPGVGASDGATTYDDNGNAVDSSSGSSRRRSSSGSSGSGGGGGNADTALAAPAFPGGGFGTPNTYPTLPMTAQRQKVLQNLSGPFGAGVGTFRTPPGGWREDMAPMFTTGAFGGVQPPSDSAGIPGGPSMAAPAPAPAPAMPDYSAFMAPAAPAPTAAPALPDPTLMPPGAEIGITPPDNPYAAPAMPVGFPAFNRPGFVAPGSPAAMQMQRQLPQQGGNAAPLPASLRQRFGL